MVEQRLDLGDVGAALAEAGGVGVAEPMGPKACDPGGHADGEDDLGDLINVALEELVRARCELPGFNTLDKMVSAIRTETNTALFAMVAARLDAAARRRLARLLWLGAPPGYERNGQRP